MIQLKHHLEVLKNKENMESWLNGMEQDEAMIWSTRIQSSYPLSDPIKPKGLFEKIDVEKMVFGHFIMIEMFLSSDMDFNDRMVNIVPLILRPTDGDFDNDNEHIEKTLRETIMMCDAAYIEDLFSRFLSARYKVVHEKYEGVIYAPPSESDDDDEVVTDAQEDAESIFNSQFHFYRTAKSMVNDDLTRLQDAYDLPMRTVFPELVYRAKKNKIDEARQRREAFMK